MKIITILLILFFTIGCGSGGSSSSSDTGQPVILPTPISDQHRPLLVIRVNYTNQIFESHEISWSNKIFGSAQSQLNHYYNEVSYGKFGFSRVEETEGTENDGVITVSLDKNHPDSSYSDSIHSDLKAALEKADEYIDYDLYDVNGDGDISSNELIFLFVIAGNEDAYSGSDATNGVWAHMSCTESSFSPVLDGVALMGCSTGGNYSIFGELHGDHDATIGIIAHELGHAAFELPDLYDIDGSSAGIGYFGLMSSGTWGYAGTDEYPGETPTHLSAWSKVYLNWIEPELQTNKNNFEVVLNESSSLNFNIIKIPIGINEYFLLENRNNSGYDRGLYPIGEYRGGVAIWHIDENVISQKLLLNEVNIDESHKGVDLEEAMSANLDNSVWEKGNAKNLFYSQNRDIFDGTNTFENNSNDYNNINTAVVVKSISTYGIVMSAEITNPN